MAIDTAFLDELRQRTSLMSLMGRRNKLVRSGRHWKTCCPFHGEKTPSLYIYDDHYHCFGCGAHGDAISFIMQSEGSGFREAVERLAAEAGLDVPVEDPQQAERSRVRQTLYEVMEEVQAVYRQKLYQSEGRGGLEYLTKRGLSSQTLERFGLGWSGDGRSLLKVLESKNITAEMLVKVGLMRVDEAGNPRGELFFNRVMFPIRDRKGRIISFGGRVLGDGQPKYLNGPETEIFSKRRTLFNIDQAHHTLRKEKGAPLVVVEGYMDVIAMAQAGFGGAVAPLGTALGAEQMELLWRMDSSPIICLDGDSAGQRAALRSCEVALPLLSAEKSLRFCRLDGGDDPDSFIGREGAEAMSALLAASRPMVEELFMLMTASDVEPTPERRAVLREKLSSLARLVPDKTLASEYRSTLMDMFFERYRKKGRGGRSDYRPFLERGASSRDFAAERINRPAVGGAEERLNILTAILLRHPEILSQVEQEYSQLALTPSLANLRVALLEWADQCDGPLKAESCRAWMEENGLKDQCEGLIKGPMPRELRAEDDDGLLGVNVLESWWHFYGLVNFPAFEREVQQAVQDAILRAYEVPSESGGGAQSFPDSVKARMRVLEALRRGEQPEIEGRDG